MPPESRLTQANLALRMAALMDDSARVLAIAPTEEDEPEIERLKVYATEYRQKAEQYRLKPQLTRSIGRAPSRPRPRGAGRPRGRRVTRATRTARGSPDDDPHPEPEPPLTAIPLERFQRDVDAWRAA